MEDKNLTVKDSSLAFLGGFILCQIAIVAATSIGLIIAKICKFNLTEFELFLNTGLGYLILTLVLDLTILAVCFFFKKKKTLNIFAKPKPIKLLIYVCVALITFILLYPIVTVCDSLLYKIGITPNIIPYTLTKKNYFISILSLVILPAVCEELLFRGIIYNGLKKHGKTFSIILTGLMFSIFHMSLTQTVYPLLMGILLSVIMFYENNIYYCITVHLISNFTSLTLSYFDINLMFNHWTYILLAILLAILFTFVILFLTLKNSKNQYKQPITRQDKTYLTTVMSIMLFLWIISVLFA